MVIVAPSHARASDVAVEEYCTPRDAETDHESTGWTPWHRRAAAGAAAAAWSDGSKRLAQQRGRSLVLARLAEDVRPLTDRFANEARP